MIISTNWSSGNENGSYLANVSVSSNAFKPSLDELWDHLAGSFVVQNYQIVVLLDAIPIKSFIVYVYKCGTDISEEHTSPQRFHFGISFKSSHEWNNPQDLFFEQESSGSFHTSYRFRENEGFPVSISFVIQLSSLNWLRDWSGQDFQIGCLSSSPVAFLELPLLWPLSHRRPLQLLSLYRANPFWLVPQFPSSFSDCMDETFFILSELETSPETKYIALLFCVDPQTGLRSSMFSSSHFDFIVRVETGQRRPIKLSSLKDSLVSAAVCSEHPFSAIRQLLQLVAKCGLDFSTRLDELGSPIWSRLQNPRASSLISTLGYCTWDAFGTHVSDRQIVDVIDWLRFAQIKIGYIIVDDGWQTVSPTENPNQLPVLVDFKANEKFNRTLATVAKQTNTPVYAWTAITGYWGGVSSAKFSRFQVKHLRGTQSRGLHRNKTEDVCYWERGYDFPFPDPRNLDKYFREYFDMSLFKCQHVVGLKIDAQSLLDVVCFDDPQSLSGFSRLEVTKNYRKALDRTFQGLGVANVVLNCMSCSPEAILMSGTDLSLSNICWRTSNDHSFPGVDESASVVAWHVLSNALNTMLLGEVFPVPDWDMFRVSGNSTLTELHVKARIMSGGLIYFSDTIPLLSRTSKRVVALMRSLVTEDGNILRCQDVGRPTKDCIFVNPMQSNILYKIFNRNEVNGIVGLFNLQIDPGTELTRGTFRPADIFDFEFLSTNTRYISIFKDRERLNAHLHSNKYEEHPVSISRLHAIIVHICPIFILSHGVELCVLGQPGLLNCGGMVSSLVYSSDIRRNGPQHGDTSIEVFLNSPGDAIFRIKSHRKQLSFIFHSSHGATNVSTLQKVVINGLHFTKANVPPVKPYKFKIKIHVENLNQLL